MKFTFNWLKDYLDTNHSLDEIVLGLTKVGLEVESVDNKAALYAAFKTAKVLEAKQHPNADRLRVCTVQTDTGIVQVVCGAPNARAGMIGVFAPDGSYIPGLDVTLKASKIRGEDSNGMLVSEREMNLSDEHNGIIDLPADTPIGKPLAEVLGLDDAVIDISITPNRPDCAGVFGVARDLAAAGYGALKPLMLPKLVDAFTTPIKITIADTKACPHFTGRLVRGVKNGASPAWMQARLRAIGLRPISALVDITNYMTIGLNRPLHVFDADKLQGNIYVRFAKAGESLVALNDKTYTLSDGMTVVCDDSGVDGLGGIMGGTSTACDENTKNVFIESAYFDPITTAMTGRSLQINSDARYRFERGIDPLSTVPLLDFATAMVVELCGGTVGSLVQDGAPIDWKKTITYRPERLTSLGGLDLDLLTQEKILAHLGFVVTIAANAWSVVPPSWRPDVMGEADIVEEICRIHGYDKIPSVSLMVKQAQGSVPVMHPVLARKTESRRVLAARGFMDCETYSFMAAKLAPLFEAVPYPQDVRDKLTLTNPIAEDLNRMRPSIIPNLVQAAARNASRGIGDVALAEVGPVFRGVGATEQPFVATGVCTGYYAPQNWQGGALVTALDAKGVTEGLLAALGVPVENLRIDVAGAPSYYHPAQSCALVLGKKVLAYCGALHPTAVEAAGGEGVFAGFEVFIEDLPPVKIGKKSALVLNPLQPVQRDFAFVVTRTTPANDVLRAAYSADKNLISAVTLFDVYQGKGLGEDEKSLAVRVHLQPTDKTLTDVELEAVSKAVITAVQAKTGARLR